MGIHPAPSFANIYLARRIDEEIMIIINKYGTNGNLYLKIFKRFLDGLFQIFTGTTKELHELYDEINNILWFIPPLKMNQMKTDVVVTEQIQYHFLTPC